MKSTEFLLIDLTILCNVLQFPVKFISWRIAFYIYKDIRCIVFVQTKCDVLGFNEFSAFQCCWKMNFPEESNYRYCKDVTFCI